MHPLSCRRDLSYERRRKQRRVRARHLCRRRQHGLYKLSRRERLSADDVERRSLRVPRGRVVPRQVRGVYALLAWHGLRGIASDADPLP